MTTGFILRLFPNLKDRALLSVLSNKKKTAFRLKRGLKINLGSDLLSHRLPCSIIGDGWLN
ncbi:hypothetical protein, partial [Halodesulfovibrio aestuarii]